MNLKNGAIESEFHRYVRPTFNPVLSDYCINLTGISQTLIDRQSRFTFVYQAFIDWLNQIAQEKQLRYAKPNARIANYNCNTAFCSWTNWDLGHYFRLDCVRNSIQWPAMLRAWIDARKTFEVSSKSLQYSVKSKNRNLTKIISNKIVSIFVFFSPHFSRKNIW